MIYKRFLKRPLDVIVAFIGLLITSPVFVLVWFLLLIQNQGKPFFVQLRPGKNHAPFYILKFKTMNDRRDANGELLPDVQRLTSFGRLVRKLSLDELPQLLNVLKGEMSLIGPRPLLFKYVPLYSPQQDRRHQVRPGITGLAQVNGRNTISWARKFELDVHYIDNLTFLMDMKIFFLTILKVIKREGINQSEARPMQPFTGNN